MITFFSNYINDHQIPFCEAMYKLTNGEFRFVATTNMSEERKKLGYLDKSEQFSFVIKSFEGENYQIALELGYSSDVVIMGEAPDVFIQKRLAENKLTFRYNERFFKEGKWRILDPRIFFGCYKAHTRYRKKNLHMLCASAYTAPDCKFIFAYPNKTYKWGYFPIVKKYENIENVISTKHTHSILWVARLIPLKHPEYPILVAKKLKEAGYDFILKIIGIGPMEEKMRDMIRKYHLEEQVFLLGAMSAEQVRLHMEQSEIFLFTSNRKEGWGAVMNESMNSACAVVANGAIGSVPYLIQSGKNGLIYKNSLSDLYKKTKWLLDNPNRCQEMGKRAYQTLTETWNAEQATKRLLQLIDDIKKGRTTRFETGPCSKG